MGTHPIFESDFDCLTDRSSYLVQRRRMAEFISPVIQDNPTGWGPCQLPEKFKNMPYQPFSKSDRLGKVSDWTGATYTDRKYVNKYQSQFASQTNNTRISTTRMSHHSNWSTTLKPNLEIDFSLD